MTEISTLPEQRRNEFVPAKYRWLVEVAQQVPAPSLDRFAVVGRHR
jgi:hypothetical protein